MAQQFALKMWCQNKVKNCKLEEEEARDPTKMKASTFSRWLGLGGCVVMFFAGAYSLATQGGFCPASGAFCLIVCIPILILEVGYFVLKPKTEMTEEEMRGPEPPKEGENKEDEGGDAEPAEEDDGEKKANCCSRCIVKVIRCCFFRKLYENWYWRALLYFLFSIFMFPCGFTLVAGVLLLLCAILYAFARWRGEIQPVVEDEPDPDAPGEDQEEEDEEKEVQKKPKTRRKKPAKKSAQV